MVGDWGCNCLNHRFCCIRISPNYTVTPYKVTKDLKVIPLHCTCSVVTPLPLFPLQLRASVLLSATVPYQHVDCSPSVHAGHFVKVIFMILTAVMLPESKWIKGYFSHRMLVTKLV